MTVATQDGPNPWAEFGNAGLEDVDARDIALPRLKILGEEAVFQNTVTNEKFPELTVIFLGLIKQRAFFADMSEETEKLGPICKSNDNETGFPGAPFNPQSPIAFPWAQAGFDPNQHPIDMQIGRVTLSCDTCKLSNWGPKTAPDKGKPPCGEVHTYPLMYSHPDTHELVPAVLQVKSSAMQASRGLINAFAGQSRPMFTAWTHISLTPLKRGRVAYAVPNFNVLFANGTSPQDQWNNWYNQWNTIRDALREPPRPFDDAPTAPSADIQGETAPGPDPWAGYADASPDANGTATWPNTQAPTVQNPPAAAPPVAATPPPSAPTQATYAPPAPQPAHGRAAPPAAVAAPPPPPPAAPVAAAPVAQAAPPAPPSPPPAPPQAASPQPPQTYAPPPVPPAVASPPDDDDLPF